MRDAVRASTDEHGRSRGADADPSHVAATPAGPTSTDQSLHVRGRYLARLRHLAECRCELLVESHPSSTPSAMPVAARARWRATIAAADCDFTVPAAQPRASAICASLRSS